jgi:hypothetical protein
VIDMRETFTIVVIAGLGLVAVSWLLPSVMGGHQAWTEEQAEAYSDAAASIHTLTYKAAQAQELAKRLGPTGNPQAAIADEQLAKAAQTGAPVNPATATADRLNAELAAAKERYRQQRAALDAARSNGQGAATVVRLFGLGVFAIGLIGMLVVRQKTPA